MTTPPVKKWLYRYFAVMGVLAHIAAAGALAITVVYFPGIVLLAKDKAGEFIQHWGYGVSSPSAAVRNAEPRLDGRLRGTHPRLLLPQLSSWNGRGVPELFQERARLYQETGMAVFDACDGGGLAGAAACWVVTGDEGRAQELMEALSRAEVKLPEDRANYGNGWELALAYDLLRLYPGLTAAHAEPIETKIETALRAYLEKLNSDGPSLWHGRTTLASMAWLCAVALDSNPVREPLVAQAQSYFIDTLAALETTEGWPEGYSYWIQDRGIYLVLAASAYVNGIEGGLQRGRVLRVLERVGLWHIYATRPDNRIEGFGDEGSRVDLKDETRRVIDLIAQTTGNGLFAGYSRYLEALHGKQSYYKDYRWGFWLFNDPVLALGSRSPRENLGFLNGLLPTSEVFGKDAFGQVFMRSDWQPDATFISFRAGDIFTHHGHYDAGHFTLFKRTPLAVNSSLYGGEYTGPNRLDYSIRTVAKNSLLILRPGEKVQPNRFFSENVADGGQRVVIPTGSAIQSLDDWRANIGSGKHLEGGRILRYAHIEGRYTYVNADLTGAYNNNQYDDNGHDGKVQRVERSLIYLRDTDQLVVYDQIAATRPEYVKKWLLHTINRPEVDALRVLRGETANGILESSASRAQISNGDGRMWLDRIYPSDAVIRLVGGPSYRYYVETDGDDTELNGKNYEQGAVQKSWFEDAQWRIEIQPGKPRKEDDFLVVLSTGGARAHIPRALAIDQGPARGVVLGQTAIIFVDPRVTTARIVFTEPEVSVHFLLVGLPPSSAVKISHGASGEMAVTNDVGILATGAGRAGGGDTVTVSW